MKILSVEKMKDIRVKDKYLHFVELQPECEADEEWIDKNAVKIPSMPPRTTCTWSVIEEDELAAMSYILELLAKAKLKCEY